MSTPGRNGRTRELRHGLLVHYVLRSMPSLGQERPAVIVRVEDPALGVVRLNVFTLPEEFEDGQVPAPVMWAEPARYSSEPRPGTWHWIEG